ncbi:unnamed protein product [Ostreobium quekettii]|uniref:Uncharacterized protein n=1 Tax=Ostreobium quekettii TaxID=121088 RepID=A0A8S1J287_9CHLO|nr:unnamed protein product [Ostreobium quekettii]
MRIQDMRLPIIRSYLHSHPFVTHTTGGRRRRKVKKKKGERLHAQRVRRGMNSGGKRQSGRLFCERSSGAVKGRARMGPCACQRMELSSRGERTFIDLGIDGPELPVWQWAVVCNGALAFFVVTVYRHPHGADCKRALRAGWC